MIPAVLHTKGRSHPFPMRLSLRTTSSEPAYILLEQLRVNLRIYSCRTRKHCEP